MLLFISVWVRRSILFMILILLSLFPKGVIRTALPNMDREVKEQYQVLIQAKDMGGQLGGLAGTTVVNITLTDVNDNPPRFPKSMSATCSPYLQMFLKEITYHVIFFSFMIDHDFGFPSLCSYHSSPSLLPSDSTLILSLIRKQHRLLKYNNII